MILLDLNEEQESNIASFLSQKGIEFKRGRFSLKELEVSQSDKEAALNHENRKLAEILKEKVNAEEERFSEYFKYPLGEINCVLKEDKKITVNFFDVRGNRLNIAGDGEMHRIKAVIIHECKIWRDCVQNLVNEQYVLSIEIHDVHEDLDKKIS